MKIAIVEDNKKENEEILLFLRRYEEESGLSFSLSSFYDGLDFVEQYRCDADIVFLDIQMPLLNGFEAAKKIAEKDNHVAIVFLTSLSSYAVDSYSVSAADFILKPIAYPSFKGHLERVIKRMERNGTGEFTLASTQSGLRKILLSELYSIEVYGHKLVYHTSGGDFTELRTPIKKKEKELEGKGFVRCNNYTLVNLKYVTGVKGNALVCFSSTHSISRSYRASLLDRLNEYLVG